MLRLRTVGFTLIELLVVITIIVVLLALLTPALDAAIYQAELVQCGAHQRGIASGAATYAVDQKRRWPTTGDLYAGGAEPQWIGREDHPQQDRRLILGSYIPLAMHADPLAAGELDRSMEANDADTFVLGDYELWFGWQYVVGSEKHPGMFRMGDRWGWRDPASGELYRFDLLATDMNGALYDGGVQTTHPDKDGVASASVFQNEAAVGANIGGISLGLKVTWARWTANTVRRGPLDIQVARTDGSVERYLHVITGSSPEDEPRMTGVPWHAEASAAPGWGRYVPNR
jgi:prepilin-type N-terminal cleavage/methylation domain-containing protein